MVLQPQVIEDGGIMVLQRHITEVPFVNNSLVTAPAIRLRPNLVKNVIVHVKMSFTSGAGGNILQDYPWRIIEHITVRSVRNEVLKTVNVRAAHLLNDYEFGSPEYNTFPATPGIAQDVVAEFDFCIPFENFTGINPEQTILNLNEFTELYFDFLWGDINLMYGETLVNPVVTTTLVFLEREPVNMSDELEPRKKLIDQTYIQPVESNQFEYLLPENTLIKTILVMLTQNDPPFDFRYPESIGRQLLNLSIEDDDNAHSMREWNGRQIQSANKSYYGIESVADGIYVIEFDQLRDLSSLYKTFGVNYPKIKLDLGVDVVGNPSNVTLLIRQVATPPAIVVPVR